MLTPRCQRFLAFSPPESAPPDCTAPTVLEAIPFQTCWCSGNAPALLRLTDDTDEAVRIIQAYARMHRDEADETEPHTKPIRRQDVDQPTTRPEQAET